MNNIYILHSNFNFYLKKKEKENLCDTANLFTITFCGPSSGNQPDELVWKQYALKYKSNKELQVWKKFIVLKFESE